MSDWWTRLQAGWMPGDRIQPTEARRRYYQAKRDVVERIRPMFIAEIGVRAGYSAFAMLDAAPEGCHYMGIDLDQGTHGGDPGCVDHARTLLAPFDAEIRVQDSQTLDRLPKGVDLLHIDGDHSFDGCLSDLQLAEDSEVRWVLVDDYDYVPEVGTAVRYFAGTRTYHTERIRDGHRGMVLIDTRTPARAA